MRGGDDWAVFEWIGRATFNGTPITMHGASIIELDGDGLIKVAKHHHGDETVDPAAYEQTVSIADENLIRSALADHLPDANGSRVKAETCLYTVTPDGDFIVDTLPGYPHVVVASPCSGHGFKFAPVMGEILANLLTQGEPKHEIGRFSLKRFA